MIRSSIMINKTNMEKALKEEMHKESMTVTKDNIMKNKNNIMMNKDNIMKNKDNIKKTMMTPHNWISDQILFQMKNMVLLMLADQLMKTMVLLMVADQLMKNMVPLTM